MLFNGDPPKDAERICQNLDVEERFYDFQSTFMGDYDFVRTRNEVNTLSAIVGTGLAADEASAKEVLKSLVDNPIRYHEDQVFELTLEAGNSYRMRVRGYEGGK